MGVHPVAARGFGLAADVYERARPGYPEPAVAWLADRLDLRAGRTVLDLGAGTGKLTRELVQTGARAIAVEPVEAMRRKLVETVPEAEALDGTAEALPLPDASVDAVTVAQAFHWFRGDEALAELHRVLRPGGSLALVWNSRDLADELQARLEDVLSPLRGEALAGEWEAWRGPFERTALFTVLEERTFLQEQALPIELLVERVASTSFVAALPCGEREEVLERVRAVTGTGEEPLVLRYVTEVFTTGRR